MDQANAAVSKSLYLEVGEHRPAFPALRGGGGEGEGAPHHVELVDRVGPVQVGALPQDLVWITVTKKGKLRNCLLRFENRISFVELLSSKVGRNYLLRTMQVKKLWVHKILQSIF